MAAAYAAQGPKWKDRVPPAPCQRRMREDDPIGGREPLPPLNAGPLQLERPVLARAQGQYLNLQPTRPPRRTAFIDVMDRLIRAGRRVGTVSPARLEMDLLDAGQAVVRVPAKLMAQTRSSARTRGKSDPIDALAVARAVLREPDLPVAAHDEASRELKLLVDRRDDLVKERTAMMNRFRWHLHRIDPTVDPKPKSLKQVKTRRQLAEFLAPLTGIDARLAREGLAWRWLHLAVLSPASLRASVSGWSFPSGHGRR